MTNKAPDGDAIADQIKHHKSTDTDISDVAHSLTDAHAHRPGLWKDDLDKANAALHQQGLLNGMDIVGIRGQDLVMKDQAGHTVLVDATNTKHQHHDAAGEKDDKVNGRHANLNPDGSGTVTAGRDDKYGWNLASDLLKHQGIDHPTANQTANYQMELEKLNGKQVSKFKAGEEIKVPPSAQYSGGGTEFNSDRIEDKYKDQVQKVDQQAAEAEAALKKFHSTMSGVNMFGTQNMTEADIDKALKRSDLTDADKRGLKFLKENYAALENHDGVHKDGVVFNWGIEQWKKAHEQEAEKQKIADYHGTL